MTATLKHVLQQIQAGYQPAIKIYGDPCVTVITERQTYLITCNLVSAFSDLLDRI